MDNVFLIARDGDPQAVVLASRVVQDETIAITVEPDMTATVERNLVTR